MNRISKLFAISALMVLMLIIGCSEDSTGPTGPGPYDALTLDLYDAAHLPGNFFYHLWAAKRDTGLAASPTLSWVSILEFNVNPVGEGGTPDTITTITGQVIPDNTLTGLSIDFEDYDSLLITIEEPGASTGLPSATAIAAAQIPDLSQQATGLLFFPVSVDSVGPSNRCQLISPTDADTSNELSGVWFMFGFEPKQQGLGLFRAPEGWTYEGWVWHDGRWLSTGKFTRPDMPDESNGYSSTEASAPDFPGEDFLLNAPAGVTFPWSLTDGDTILVTLEPSPDTDEGPFALRLREATLVTPFPFQAVFLPPVTVRPGGNAVMRRSEEL